MSDINTVKTIFDLYRKYGEQDYIGEELTQKEHAIQCAMLASKEGYPDPVVLGAFLHDIGHLLEAHEKDHMFTDGVKLGIKDHEVKGEVFLKELGMPTIISDIARGHVDAKRYLCYKDEEYYNGLSPASKMTLEHQRGPMNKDESQQFEANQNFEIIIKARKWDEAAKEKNITLQPLSYYEDMMIHYLSSN